MPTSMRRMNNNNHLLQPHKAITMFLGLFLLLSLPFRIQADNDGSACPQKYTLAIPEAAAKFHRNKNKLIIAHRGASYHLPEHSLAAYRLALELGTDFVEPDLVATQDGHLIVMHSVDLNVTTNVEELFGETRQPWFSPYVNRSGYWSFNFTLDEIKQLRIHQRLPRARTTIYDGMFEVPTFQEVQALVTDWNTQILPALLLHVDENGTQQVPPDEHHHYPQSAGVYAELKSSDWFARDANMSLVDLFIQEITDHPDNFASVTTCPDIFKYDEYKVPPLVVQSFEGWALKDLAEKWKVHPVLKSAPMPPQILLVSLKGCWEESVWFEIGETWRAHIQGLGMDKACFPRVGEKVEEGKGAKGRAEEFNLVIHPYTERPEHEFLLPGFQDDFDEIQHLFCTIGAQGIFTEAVHTARMVIQQGCGEENAKASEGATETEETSSNPTSSFAADSKDDGKPKKFVCWEDSSEGTLYFGVASFVMGVFLTSLISMWVNRGFSCTRRPPRQQQIPTGEYDNDRSSIEEPPDDELL